MNDSMNWTVEETPTLREQTAEVLRGALARQEFAPGERLVERTLAARIGVSRTSVREALGRLEAEGLVMHTPGKGVFVTSVGEDEARQIYEARAILESAMARLFVARATEDDLAALGNAIALADETNRPDQARQHAEKLDAVSDIIMRGAGNEETRQMASVLRSRVTYLRMITTRAAPATHRDRTMEMLRDILAAFRDRDAERADRLTRAYVERSAVYALDLVRRLAREADGDRDDRAGHTGKG